MGHACTVATISGVPRLIISGGQNGGRILSSVESLGLAGSEAGTWASLADLPLPRRHHIITALASPARLLVAGGHTASYSLVSHLVSLDLEQEAGGWNTIGHLASPRTGMVAAVVEEKYCTGRRDQNLF